MAFGPRPGDLEAFQALGGDDESRLETYVDQQLDPESINDEELDARLERYTTLTKSQTQLWAEHTRGPSSARNQPLHETEAAVFIRAVHSKRQLREVLADFWNNHFNVFPQSGTISSVFSHYDNSVIRPNLLGNFREMLEAVATSPAMLFYLDNYLNINAGPNENYARELFELHTLGADRYLGVVRQNEVPRDEAGKPVGYVDDDVYEATRSLTGWTVNEDTGEFFYRTDRHDRFQKNVLGQFLPPDQPPLADGKMVLDLLASHPGTGRHIAYKLCRRLVADHPSPALVEEVAQVFTATWQAPDQLAQVTRRILLSQEFRLTWGRKVKRPFEVLTSFLRGLGTTFISSVTSFPGQAWVGKTEVWDRILQKQKRLSGKENQMNPDLEKRVPREILAELIEEGTEAFRGILEKLFNVAMQLERSLGAERTREQPVRGYPQRQADSGWESCTWRFHRCVG